MIGIKRGKWETDKDKIEEFMIIFNDNTIIQLIFQTIVTEPSNMKISATRIWRIRSSYFGPLSFTTVGDPYIDPDKVLT